MSTTKAAATSSGKAKRTTGAPPPPDKTTITTTTTASSSSSITPHHRCVDIGVNLTHRTFQKHWRDVVQRAIDHGVGAIVLTGTSLKGSRASLKLAQTWTDETKQQNLYCTVGIHPHDAKHFDAQNSIRQMKELLTNDKNRPWAVAVGECGLDYNRNFSTKQEQLRAFSAQVDLACELQLPLFVHEREAHHDLVQVLDKKSKLGKEQAGRQLPPVVVHCFTGTHEEAMAYIQRGYYLGFTGFICKQERGRQVREFLADIPLDRIMIETDAPFMGFQKGKQRNSEPAHVVGVAQKIAQVHGVSLEVVCQQTTQNALAFFGLEK